MLSTYSCMLGTTLVPLETIISSFIQNSYWVMTMCRNMVSRWDFSSDTMIRKKPLWGSGTWAEIWMSWGNVPREICEGRGVQQRDKHVKSEQGVYLTNNKKSIMPKSQWMRQKYGNEQQEWDHVGYTLCRVRYLDFFLFMLNFKNTDIYRTHEVISLIILAPIWYYTQLLQ